VCYKDGLWTIKSEGHVYEIDTARRAVRWKKGSRGHWIPWMAYDDHFIVVNKRIELTLQVGIVLTIYLPSVRYQLPKVTE
jgi:hypothetical protein